MADDMQNSRTAARPSELSYDNAYKDPLVILGPSIFLSIISHLPFSSILAADRVNRQWNQIVQSHSRSIWRGACHRTGVYQDRISKIEKSENAASLSIWETPPSEPTGTVEHSTHDEWKTLCREHVEEDRNWRFGRPKERWMEPGHHAVWRMKVDPEQDTLITTSRSGECLRCVMLCA